MTLEQAALVAQIVGVVVVAATLIYLAMQVHQGARQMRSEGRQAQLTYDQTGVYKFVDFPELGRIFSQEETPSFEEKTKLFFWMIGQMRLDRIHQSQRSDVEVTASLQQLSGNAGAKFVFEKDTRPDWTQLFSKDMTEDELTVAKETWDKIRAMLWSWNVPRLRAGIFFCFDLKQIVVCTTTSMVKVCVPLTTTRHMG